MWIKNTNGKKDAVLTMSLIGFITVTLKVLLSNVTCCDIYFGTIDSATITAILTPTLGAYVIRRYTSACKGDTC